MTRGRKPTAAGAELASAVLSDLAASLPRAEVARRHGISRARVQAIARAAGLPSGGRGGGSQPSTLLARLRELADAAGEDPADWLEDAARCIKACEAIVVVLDELPRNDGASPSACDQIKRFAIGPHDPALAAQVRAVVEADGGGTAVTLLCRAEHPKRRGFDCELHAGHDGAHRYLSGGSRLTWPAV